MPAQVLASYPVTPERFWELFAEEFRNAWFDEARSIRAAYDHATPWTTFMTGLLMDMGKKLGCHPAQEYMRIDVGYFTVPAADWDHWAMEVAIEIENDVYWTEEIAKLMMINAGLKVLIAYDDPGKIDRVLGEFLEIHSSRKYLTANDTWLFIFGPRVSGTSQDFTARKFVDGHIVSITADTKILSFTHPEKLQQLDVS